MLSLYDVPHVCTLTEDTLLHQCPGGVERVEHQSKLCRPGHHLQIPPQTSQRLKTGFVVPSQSCQSIGAGPAHIRKASVSEKQG